MDRIVFALVTGMLVTPLFAGCLGDDDTAGLQPVPVVAIAPGPTPDSLRFDASSSTGKGLTFHWDFGDGTDGEGAKTTHTYPYGPGVYTVTLHITDLNDLGATWRDKVQVGTGQNAPPVAFFTPSARIIEVGGPFRVDAGATYDPEGDPVRYEWDFNFPMRMARYHDFREAKAATDPAAGQVEGKGAPSGPPTTDGWTAALRDALHKSPDHGSGAPEPAPSTFDGRRSSTEPVYTLEEGFPEPTWFYVKLTAIDVKGASERIVSEEIWPVEVVSQSGSPYHLMERNGTFTLGVPAMLDEHTPDDEDIPYTDHEAYTFLLPGPLMDQGRSDAGSGSGGGAIPSLWINLTWDDGLGATLGELQNTLQIHITDPTGTRYDPRHDPMDGATIRFSLGGSGPVHEGGTWTVALHARSGADIDYTLTFWAMVDQNPFREIEASF